MSSAKFWMLPCTSTYLAAPCTSVFGDCISKEDSTIGRVVFPLRLPWFVRCLMDVTDSCSFFLCCDAVLDATNFL